LQKPPYQIINSILRYKTILRISLIFSAHKRGGRKNRLKVKCSLMKGVKTSNFHVSKILGHVITTTRITLDFQVFIFFWHFGFYFLLFATVFTDIIIYRQITPPYYVGCYNCIYLSWGSPLYFFKSCGGKLLHKIFCFTIITSCHIFDVGEFLFKIFKIFSA